jgi:hypothetical protein
MSLHLEKFCWEETIGQSIRRENGFSSNLVCGLSGGERNHSGKYDLKELGRSGNLWSPPRVKSDVEYKTIYYRISDVIKKIQTYTVNIC